MKRETYLNALKAYARSHRGRKLLEEAIGGGAPWVEAYVRGAEALEGGDLAAACSAWEEVADDPAPYDEGVVRNMGVLIIFHLERVTDESVREEPDMSPVLSLVRRMHLSGRRLAARELTEALLDAYTVSMERGGERTSMSRLAYMEEVLMTDLLPAMSPRQARDDMGDLLSCERDLDGMKGGRPTERLRGMSELVRALGSSLGARVPSSEDPDQAPISDPGAWTDILGEMRGLRREFVAGALSGSEGRAAADELVAELLETRPEPVPGRTCMDCRRWSPLPPGGAWKCPVCGNEDGDGSRRALLRTAEEAVFNDAEMAPLLRAVSGRGDLEAHMQACIRCARENMAGAVDAWCRGLPDAAPDIREAARDVILSAVERPVESQFPTLMDAESMVRFCRWSGCGMPFLREVMDAAAGNGLGGDHHYLILSAAMAAAVLADRREEAADAALAAYMALDSFGEDPMADLADALYVALEGCSDEGFASRRSVLYLDMAALDPMAYRVAEPAAYLSAFLGQAPEVPAPAPARISGEMMPEDLMGRLSALVAAGGWDDADEVRRLAGAYPGDPDAQLLLGRYELVRMWEAPRAREALGRAIAATDDDGIPGLCDSIEGAFSELYLTDGYMTEISGEEPARFLRALEGEMSSRRPDAVPPGRTTLSVLDRVAGRLRAEDAADVSPYSVLDLCVAAVASGPCPETHLRVAEAAASIADLMTGPDGELASAVSSFLGEYADALTEGRGALGEGEAEAIASRWEPIPYSVFSSFFELSILLLYDCGRSDLGYDVMATALSLARDLGGWMREGDVGRIRRPSPLRRPRPIKCDAPFP